MRFKAGEAGIRLDKFVVAALPEFSRAYIQKLFDQGLVLLNGRQVKAGEKTRAGDELTVSLPPPAPCPLTPEPFALDIVYEDNDVLVVDKPAGMTVYPAAGHASHTLLNAALAHSPELGLQGDTLRPGIVHRLDKDTSGLMVIAKNSVAREYLVGQFKERRVLKVYLVLVLGRITPEQGRIEAPIGRHPVHRQRMAVVSTGRASVTSYTVKKSAGSYSLLDVKLETGRTHQIRVHFAAIGYPVAGDAIYGVRVPFLKRQFVHAHRLGFYLPSTGEWREFVSPLARDLEEAVKAAAKGS